MEFYSVDFETYYDKSSFTLKKLSTAQYVTDPRFQVLCLAIYNPKTQAVLPPEAIPGWLASLDPRKIGFIAQHAQFDGLIFSWKYGFAPGYWADTLSMSRLVSGMSVKHSLAAQCERYGLPPKTIDYDDFNGLRLADLRALGREQRLQRGCLDDAARTWRIAEHMAPHVPSEEMDLINLTVRMFTEPRLHGDQERLNALVMTERERKAALLADLDVDPADIKSDDRFESLLLDLGVDVEYKPAKNKRGFKGAFAKSDEFMQNLLHDQDEYISGIAQLRVDLKSTIQESRAERLLNTARRGPLPVYYYFYGARNSRWAGGEGDNFQNLPSRGKNGVELRKSIKAPKGKKLVVGDLSQIECRMLLTIAGQFDKLQAFREGRDLYCELATKFFGRPITKADEFERQMGKTGVLQLGYQSGWRKVQQAAKRLGGVDLSEEECKAFVRTYRDDNLRICGWRDGRRLTGGIWQYAETWLEMMAQGQNFEHWAPQEPGQPCALYPLLRFVNQKIYLPNGLPLHFDGVKWGEFMSNGEVRNGWVVPTIDGHTPFYGGKLVQNINSALARIVMSQAELRVVKRIADFGNIVLHTHDDFAALVPEDRAEETKLIMIEEMTRPPVWLPNIPLATEVKILDDYAK